MKYPEIILTSPIQPAHKLQSSCATLSACVLSPPRGRGWDWEAGPGEICPSAEVTPTHVFLWGYKKLYIYKCDSTNNELEQP